MRFSFVLLYRESLIVYNEFCNWELGLMRWCCARHRVPTKAGASASCSRRKAFALMVLLDFCQTSVQLYLLEPPLISASVVGQSWTLRLLFSASNSFLFTLYFAFSFTLYSSFCLYWSSVWPRHSKVRPCLLQALVSILWKRENPAKRLIEQLKR